MAPFTVSISVNRVLIRFPKQLYFPSSESDDEMTIKNGLVECSASKSRVVLGQSRESLYIRELSDEVRVREVLQKSLQTELHLY